MIDPYHMEAYGKLAVNYNRDVEIFPVLRAIFERIQGKSPYQSPTDMGVNNAGFCITDDEACCDASRREIVRRYFAAGCAKLRGSGEDAAVGKIEILMEQAGVSPENRRSARARQRSGGRHGQACRRHGAFRRQRGHRQDQGSARLRQRHAAQRAQDAGRHPRRGEVDR